MEINLSAQPAYSRYKTITGGALRPSDSKKTRRCVFTITVRLCGAADTLLLCIANVTKTMFVMQKRRDSARVIAQYVNHSYENASYSLKPTDRKISQSCQDPAALNRASFTTFSSAVIMPHRLFQMKNLHIIIISSALIIRIGIGWDNLFPRCAESE